MLKGEIRFMGAVVSLLLVVVVWYQIDRHHDLSNINDKATTFRGRSICEISNAKTEEVLVGNILRGSKVLSSPDFSTVRCSNVTTGELSYHEFNNVLYRDK